MPTSTAEALEASSMGIGTLLLDRGLISDAQLAAAIGEQQQTGERLDHALVRLGFVRSQDVLEAIGQQFGMPIVDLSAIEVDDATLRMLPPKLIFKQRCVPIRRTPTSLQIATCDPFELSAFDELKLLTGVPIELVLAEEREIDKFIRANYGVAGDTLDALAAESGPAAAEEAGSDEVELAQEASVIRLVNDLLLEAIRERATDIHIEPYEDRLAIRYRIDGVLAEAGVPPTISRFRNAITSRLKIMANLNIAEKRRPQDGRISLRQKGKEFDLRVSVIPMLSGEGVVLRILNKSAVLMDLEELGMPSGVRERWDALIARPHGILLVTGPTGSGKSTTLYASLGRIVSDAVKAITVEDPVEYHVPGVNQIQVNHQVGLDFAAGLRSVLRHDPDIIMIGEIRDFETAQAAVQASLTGHLVFSTLHTNDAPGAITRLVDMGIEPFLVASSVEGVMAQRLVRRICPACATTRLLEPSEVPEGLQLDPLRSVREGRGCRECRQSGYRGRLGVYELLGLGEELRELILARTSSSRIAAAALAAGQLDPLRDDALSKVAAGITTIAEAMRVVRS
jgi:type II secretory ATPase GspE/PulE/Tfp pilus assembly ATPase PilB-like protein